MKTILRKGLMKLGHIQALLLLTLFYFVVLTPYGLLIRTLKRDLLPPGRWQDSEDAEITLESLRRSF